VSDTTDDKLSGVDLLALDYDGKVKLLERVTQELLNLRIEYAKVSGRTAELNANLHVLREVKSALQTAIRAEGPM
jgi:hypothetical protein